MFTVRRERDGLSESRPRYWRWVAAAFSLSLIIGGCADGAERSRGGTVVIAEGADLSKPHPLVSESSLDNQLGSVLYRPLLQPEWRDGELVYLTADESPMALARGYEFFGPDSASIRYRLRSDARWSDGRPITAHDARWTIVSQGLEQVASPRQDYSREIREVVVEDDSTLVVHFTRRYAEILFHTAGVVAPRHPYEGSDLSQLRSHRSLVEPAGNLVTSGPFMLTGWTRGQQVVLERNPYFEPEALLDRVVFRIIPEETTRIIELQTGNVDMTQVPYHFIPEVRRSADIRIETQRGRSYEYIAYNPRAHEFFADPEIRRALSLAIDVRAIISGLEMEEFAVPAGGPYPPIFKLLYDAEGQPVLPYDSLEARRILGAKGWAPGADGILRKDGVPFRFTLLTNGENRRRVDVAQIVERQWRRIGVEARIQTLEFNTIGERMNERSFEALIGGWGVALSADLNQLWGNPDLPFNIVGYANTEVHRLFDTAVQQPTAETAAPYWRQAASIIASDHPYTWLYYYDTPYGLRNRFKGNRIDTLGQYQRSWEWYAEE